ncbi:MAG: polyprenyl synthetase family protein [candidate division KSB1 bacterium]|nr:polyprenyl synthetase family protein [candidate division KSB1 bacterium]
MSFYGPVRYILEGGGKRLRPVLVLLSAEAVGSPPEEALPCALAVELMHNFTLVHDDIMDRDTLRRGRPTVHVLWDQDTAILTGDGLLALAYQQLFRYPSDRLTRIGSIFSEGVLRVCEGQALDKDFESRPTVSLDEYMEMIDKKTAELFSVSCQLGALTGSGDDRSVEALGNYGRKLGLAFQIQDDLLDVLSPEEISGKPQASDIRRRKKTFLFVHALTAANEQERTWLLETYAGSTISEENVQKVMELFRSTGAIERAEALVSELLAAARRALAGLPRTEGVEHLENLTLVLSGRRA